MYTPSACLPYGGEVCFFKSCFETFCVGNRLAGLEGVGPVSVLPLATGMALTLTLLALRPQVSLVRAQQRWLCNVSVFVDVTC